MKLDGNQLFSRKTGFPGPRLRKTVLKHFRVPGDQIATAGRQFPISSRVDIESAIDELLQSRTGTRLLGLFSPNPHEPISLAQLLSRTPFGIEAGPLQYDEIDIGDTQPRRCLKNALWLAWEQDLPFAVTLSTGGRFGFETGVQVEIAVPIGEEGSKFSQDLFRNLESISGKGATYRGRIISLEAHIHHMGFGSMVKVHRLPKVHREDVILPRITLDLLDRNVTGFNVARPYLKSLHFQARKGLLFYGPPGTGKTHTIHYLASQLPGHTTLLITAEQVGLLGEYFRLARFLQPSVMVIEDVDLIARERTHMHTAWEEATLNKLLNEMDGLQEDAEVLFILTTNRPEQIEPALTSRPGRIDQAIEFPLPDAESRAKLTRLYSRGLEISQDLIDQIVSRTKGVSAAFIKELMRRCAQFQFEISRDDALAPAALDAALEELLITGGALNRRLIGGAE
ncbi:MAG: 26S protease regulatory subunit [Acidobacteriaceae bacterium]|nr:26S protease regulatory subunit [Acidobacteriaceae bacterium]